MGRQVSLVMKREKKNIDWEGKWEFGPRQGGYVFLLYDYRTTGLSSHVEFFFSTFKHLQSCANNYKFLQYVCVQLPTLDSSSSTDLFWPSEMWKNNIKS